MLTVLESLLAHRADDLVNVLLRQVLRKEQLLEGERELLSHQVWLRKEWYIVKVDVGHVYLMEDARTFLLQLIAARNLLR